LKKIDYILVSLGVLLVLSGSGVFAILKYMSSPNRGVPMVYANSALLLETWNEYKNDAIEASSHRTIDKTQNNITTSEGESYTMLRAVWMDDKTTFDQSWQFTQDNMQRSDHLMSWKFGLRSDGTYGVLNTQGGMNTASDADGDIALSLLMAYSRWNEPSYLYQAKQIINLDRRSSIGARSTRFGCRRFRAL
jgi:endo-1,4-beta-D-glucanase Y